MLLHETLLILSLYLPSRLRCALSIVVFPPHNLWPEVQGVHFADVHSSHSAGGWHRKVCNNTTQIISHFHTNNTKRNHNCFPTKIGHRRASQHAFLGLVS